MAAVGEAAGAVEVTTARVRTRGSAWSVGVDAVSGLEPHSRRAWPAAAGVRVANDEKGTNVVKIKVGAATVGLVVAVMLWLLASHTVHWVVSTGLPH